jgi:hypothetical protein
MKNKETLKEAAVSWWQNKQVIQQKGLCRIYIPGSNYLNLQANEILFIFNNENKDWRQERSYSEEEVHKILGSYSAHIPSFSPTFTYQEWFEQFKNK